MGHKPAGGRQTVTCLLRQKERLYLYTDQVWQWACCLVELFFFLMRLCGWRKQYGDFHEGTIFLSCCHACTLHAIPALKWYMLPSPRSPFLRHWGSCFECFCTREICLDGLSGLLFNHWPNLHWVSATVGQASITQACPYLRGVQASATLEVHDSNGTVLF